MNQTDRDSKKITLESWVWIKSPNADHAADQASAFVPQKPVQPSLLQTLRRIDVLLPLRQWLDRLEIKNSDLAHRICQFIPAQCPFERDIKVFGYTLLHIPPLCKLNPLYEQFVGLRFRALCYLADDCGEDISRYC